MWGYLFCSFWIRRRVSYVWYFLDGRYWTNRSTNRLKMCSDAVASDYCRLWKTVKMVLPICSSNPPSFPNLFYYVLPLLTETSATLYLPPLLRRIELFSWFNVVSTMVIALYLARYCSRYGSRCDSNYFLSRWPIHTYRNARTVVLEPGGRYFILVLFLEIVIRTLMQL